MKMSLPIKFWNLWLGSYKCTLKSWRKYSYKIYLYTKEFFNSFFYNKHFPKMFWIPLILTQTIASTFLLGQNCFWPKLFIFVMMISSKLCTSPNQSLSLKTSPFWDIAVVSLAQESVSLALALIFFHRTWTRWIIT